MKNILLICSAGMSTSLMVKKMQDTAEARGEEVKIWAVADAAAKDNIPEADVVLLGPQIRFMLPQMKELAGDKPTEVIDMRDYALMNGEAVLNQAMNLLH